jgi:toxin FitB
MIILDTDVLSALMRRPPDPAVVAWLDEQPGESIWTTEITVFEIRFGLALLDPGLRRRRLEEAFARALTEDLGGRVIPFDQDAATEAAARAAERRTAGRPVDFRDLEIAGVVVARRATLATSNTRDFQGLGIPLVDPWAER